MTADDKDLRAMELALGLEQPGEGDDDTVRDEAAAWQALFAEVGPGFMKTPPARVKAEIDRRLGFAADEREEPGFFASVAFWRFAAMACASLALVFAALLVLPGLQRPAEEAQVFVLLLEPTVEGQQPTPAVLFTEGGEARVSIPNLTAAAPNEEPSAFDRQLWLILEGEDPRSLGLLPDTEEAQLRVTDRLARAIGAGATVAVSLEPEGGSPTGLPTGPVLALGVVTPV